MGVKLRMRGKVKIVIGIVIAAIVIPSVIYTISPLFINTTINEPIPVSASPVFEKFMNLTEEGRIQAADNMTQQEKMMIMTMAAKKNNTINENMSVASIQETANKSRSSNFVGAGDGFHNAEGKARVIQLANGNNILRLENFKATNGPDLYVYLSTGKVPTDFVSLGRLKGNVGNQNYEIPTGNDLKKYNTVLIWCRTFSVLFGSAHLS
jgi:hypothetical protein